MDKNFNENQINFLKRKIFGSISVISPRTGLPHITPVWLLEFENKLYVITTTQSSKYKFITKNSNKVGVTVTPPDGYPYLGIAGVAQIRYKTEFSNYKTIVTHMVNKYIKKDDADARIERIMHTEDRIMIEITPEKIFGTIK